MIGDADGEMSKTVTISNKNPFAKRLVKLLNSLKPPKGYWGFSLNEDDIESIYNKGKGKQITKDDFNFLNRMLNNYDGDYYESYKVSEEDEKYIDEFEPAIISEITGSYLIFQNVKKLK